MEGESYTMCTRTTLWDRIKIHLSNIKTEHIVVLLVALFMLLFIVYPYGTMLKKSIATGTGSFTLQHIKEAIEDRDYFLEPLLNSLTSSFFITVITLIIAMPFGYLVSKTDLPFKKVISVGLVVPYILPAYSLTMAWILLLTRNGILEYFLGRELHAIVYGYWPMILIQAIHTYPFAFILLTNAFGQLNQELFDAGKIHGGEKVYVLRRILIPLLAPAILSSALLVFAYAMAAFAPYMLLGGPVGVYTMTTQIWIFSTNFPTNLHMASVLSITLMICTLTVLILNQVYLGRRRFTTVTGKASRIEIISLGRWKYVTLSVCFAFLFVVIVVPLVTLFLGSTIDIWGKGYTWANLTLRHFGGLITDNTYKRSIVNVFLLAVFGGGCATILGMIISYFIIRGGSVTSKSLNFAAFFPFVIPGMVIGIGLILAFNRAPLALYGTLWILLVGYVVRFLPIVTSSGMAAFRQIDEELEDAARIFGATWIKTQIKILLPILKSALFGAWLLVFVSIMKEVSMTSIIWSPGTEVAPIMALIQFADGHFSEAVSLTLILAIIVIIGTWLAVRIGAVKFVEIE